MTRIHIWNTLTKKYEEKTIAVDTLCGLLKDEGAWEFDNAVFNEIDTATNLPYGYKLIKVTQNEYATVEAAV